MIHATIERSGAVIMRRTYADPNLSLDNALTLMEQYVTDEQLNVAGECTIRVIFRDPQAVK